MDYSDGMKEKILYMTRILTTGLLWSMILTPLAYSKTHISTQIKCNGNCTVKQTVNNQTIEIETNESASIFTKIKDSIVNFFVNAAGKGSLKTDLSGNYSVNVTVDNETETRIGMSVFSVVYDFFNKILFFGWSR